MEKEIAAWKFVEKLENDFSGEIVLQYKPRDQQDYSYNYKCLFSLEKSLDGFVLKELEFVEHNGKEKVFKLKTIVQKFSSIDEFWQWFIDDREWFKKYNVQKINPVLFKRIIEKVNELKKSNTLTEREIRILNKWLRFR